MDDGARTLGEREIVLWEGVLRPDAASGHAGAAMRAAGASRPSTAEEWIGARDPGAVAKIDGDRSEPEGVPNAHIVGDRLHDEVASRHERVVDDSEHPRSLVVVRRKLLAPVGDVAPLRIIEELLGRHIQGVRVVQRTAADSGAGEHHDILEDMNPLDAGQSETGCPQE